MPLLKSKSKKAFSKNVETEMHEGKPQDQSLAIAYSMKRKAEKKKCEGGEAMAEGGDVEVGVNMPAYSKEEEEKLRRQGLKAATGKSEAGQAMRAKHPEEAKKKHEQALEELRVMPNPKMDNMAEGGSVEGGYQDPCSEPGCADESHEHMNEEAGGYMSESAPEEEPTEQGLTGSGYQTGAHELDMVKRALKKYFSEGGEVANETSPVADFEPNEFDDLVNRDDLSSSYTGSNSGDEAGDEENDKRVNGVVARAMTRYFKQRNPNPA